MFYSLSQTIEKFAEINGLRIKVGRKPIVKDWEIASAFIISYLTHKRVFKIFSFFGNFASDISKRSKKISYRWNNN